MERAWATVDGHEACAAIAYQLSDVIAIYPITPSSSMASETRFQLTAQQDPDRYRDLVSRAQQQIQRRLALYQELAGRPGGHA